MELTGTQVIKAPRAEVWRRLNDPTTLQKCLPGCEQYQKSDGEKDGETDGESYDAVIVAAIGPIKARFKGTARFSDLREGVGYRIEGNGTGGMAGFGKLGADVRLEDIDGGTSLHYAAVCQMGGKLAQIGSRLVGAVANKFLADFFARFERLVMECGEEGSQAAM